MDDQNRPDLQKLRRFSLAIGLILLTYSMAAVEIPSDEVIRPLGLPVKIGNPNLLGIALVLASVYGMLRFYYYGVVLHLTPRKRRLALLRKGMLVHSDRLHFESPAFDSENDAAEFLDRLSEVFPTSMYAHHSEIEERDGHYVVRFGLPRSSRATTLVHDLDYTAPVWINVIALVVALLSASSEFLRSCWKAVMSVV